MKRSKKGAAQYTEVSLDDMKKFLLRGFGALHPKQGQKNGEFYYDLKLGPHVAVRVWTSVRIGSGMGAGVGADAIRVQLVSLKDQGPLERGKAPIVKRTQGWRASLQDRIEDCLEKYEEKDEFWEQWAETRQRVGDPERAIELQRQKALDEDGEGDDGESRYQQREPASREVVREVPLEKLHGDISPKQVGFIRSLLKTLDHHKWKSLGLDDKTGFSMIPSDAQLRTLGKRQGSEVIEILLKAGYGRRYASEELRDLGVDFTEDP